jgi:multimeric flavodoxin WrbA
MADRAAGRPGDRRLLPGREAVLVVGLSGSPRAGGNSDTLLSAFLEGARTAGAETDTIHVRDLEVAGCLECLRCREGACPQPDDAPATLGRLSTADAVIVASPVFFCGVPAQLKALIDRAQPLWLRRQPPDHPRRQWRAGYVISTAASTRPDVFLGTRQTLRSFLATLGTTILGELTEGGLEGPREAAGNTRLIKRARAEGARLVRELRLRRRTLRREWLEAETDLIEHAGEIPEVALNAALHSLEASPEGPGLSLTPLERRGLERAALRRFERILLRDLTFRNRRFAIFRGTSRAIINYERLVDFARRYRFPVASLRRRAAEHLGDYLAAEIASGWRCRSLDCERDALERFAERLGLDLAPFKPRLGELFERPPLHWEETQRLAFMAATTLYPFRFCRRMGDAVEIGVASDTEEAPQVIRIGLPPDPEATLARAQAVCQSIPKPDLPPREARKGPPALT